MESDNEFIEERNAFESFYSTSDENSRALLENSYESAEEFLVRQEHISIRSAYATELLQESTLKFDIDYDGCVIELSSMNGLLLPAEHLYLLPHGLGSVRPVCSVLKKHIDLTRFSRSQLEKFRSSFGIQILYSHGWEVWLGLIPDETKSTPDYQKETIRICSFKTFLGLRHLFGAELKAHVGTGCVRNSLMKTALTMLTRLRLLPDERAILFSLFQKSIDKMDVLNGFKPILFAFRFGERASQPISLEYFESALIRNMSVHIGCTISGRRGIQILWSRTGIQRVTGSRGTMLSCLTFFEACNWQSNLDGRALDIPNSLVRLCSDGQVRFIQFYGDTPHRRHGGKPYPVSGYIVSGGLFPPQMLKSFSEDSERFINTVSENAALLQDLRCRVEIVSWFDCVPENMTSILNITALQQLIAMNPMLVPFFDSDGNVLERLRKLIKYLGESLNKLKAEQNCTGEFRSSWQAFQLEMALYKMFWGHQQSGLVNQHSINMGPGIDIPSRCRTDQLGFLAFEEPTSSTADERSTPPLELWSKNRTYRKRVQRLFGFSDYKESSNVVVGKRLIMLLFGDLLDNYDDETKVNQLIASCKSVEGKVLVRALSKASLANMISKPRGGNTCYRRAISILEKSGRTETEEILCAGLSELSFTSFPAVRLFDKSRNEAFYWDERTFFRIEHNTDKVDQTSKAVAMTEKVVVELEKRKCIYMTKLKCFGDKFAFPWTECILSKLQGGGPKWKKLEGLETVKVLSFLSAVALLQQGWFVPYESLYQLEQDCPLAQSTLRSLEIQSQYILFRCGWKNIWKIHPSINIKLGAEDKKGRKSSSRIQSESKVVFPPVADSEHDNEDDVFKSQDVVKVSICHVPDNMFRRWNSEELGILYEVKQIDVLPTVKLKYNKYREICCERGLPDRSMKAFSLKLAKV